MRRSRTNWLRPALVFALVAASATCLAWGQDAGATAPLTRAKIQIDRGDIDNGEKTIWTVLSSDPNNEKALTLLGIVRGRQRRYAEAESLFRRALQLNPKSMLASRSLAGVLMALGKPDAAMQQYHAAIDLSPRDVDLKIELARLEMGRSDFTGVLSTLETIPPKQFPAAAIPLEAASLLGAGRGSDARALIPKAQGSPGILLDLAQIFLEGSDPDAALKTLSLLHAPPKNLSARIYYLRGRALRQKGDAAAAAGNFQQAIAADPKSEETLVAMAEVFAMENKHADSVAILEKARLVNPDSREVLRHLTVEAMRAGQNDKALEAAQELQRKSAELEDRYLVATVMLQQKQFLPATHILEDYVEQRPKEAKAYLGLGIAYLSVLRYADARQALERALRINPDLAEGHYQLGVLASQQGSREEAIQHWQKAVALKPDHAQALFLLGTMQLESGQLADAESLFRRAQAADPTNMKTEYDLALVLNKVGKADEAKQHFQRYRQMQDAEHSAGANSPASDHP